MASIRTVDGYAAVPPGTYSPARSMGMTFCPMTTPLALAYNKAVSLLTLVKLADIVRRLLTQNTQKLGLDRFERRIYLLRADGQVVKSGTVKASAVLEQRPRLRAHEHRR